MNWKRIVAIIAVLALVALIVFKLKSNKETATNRIYHYDKEQAIHVETQTIKLEEIVQSQTFSGTFESNKETKISAETQGKINYISVNEGDFVKQGQTLIQLDNSLLKLQLQSADIKIEELEMDVNRYTILAQSDAIQGVKLEKTKLGLKTAKVQRATLLEQINKTTIKAPFSGYVTMKFTEIGGFAAPGVPLIQITDLSLLKFTINVAEIDLKQFELGKTFEIIADIYPDQTLTGKITLIGHKANMGGSYPVQFTVKNSDNAKIKAGMFGKVLLKNEASEKGYLIPSSAIISSSNQTQVYIVKDGKAHLKKIQITQKVKSKSQVSSGLQDGDIVVVNGLINLFDGANVKTN